MPEQHFSHVTTWVFDLDNTLYPPHMRLFDQIEVRMTDWVMQALQVDRARADHLRAYYWQTYGTTLAGLMREHDVDPGPYLNEVHDIDFSVLSPDPDLARAVAALSLVETPRRRPARHLRSNGGVGAGGRPDVPAAQRADDLEQRRVTQPGGDARDAGSAHINARLAWRRPPRG